MPYDTQSRQTQSGLSRTSTLLVILTLALLGYTIYVAVTMFAKFGSMGGFSFPPATVVVAKIEPMAFSDTIEAVGTAQANESATLTSKVTETVRAIDFAEGQTVAAGTVLIQLSDAEEKASLTEAQRAFDRADELVKRKAVSIARKDTERMRMDMAAAQVGDRQIRAPFDGVLGLRQVSVGDLVSPGTIITTIDDIDPIKLEFSVPEIFLSAITRGARIQARTEAFSGEVFEGIIIAVDPRIDPATRAFRVKAEIPNASLKLKSGLLMAVDIVRNTRDALAVPEQGLIYKGNDVSVMLVGPDKKAQAASVKLGTRRGGFVEITSGLKQGDTVIVEGLIKVQPGADVNVVATKTIAEFMAAATDFAVEGKQPALKALGMQAQVETDTPPIKEELKAAPVETTPPTQSTGE